MSEGVELNLSLFRHGNRCTASCTSYPLMCNNTASALPPYFRLVFQGSRTDGTACAGCADKTQPVTVDGDGKWYCEACVEEFNEELEQQQQQQQEKHKKQGKAKRGKRAVDWQETRREANCLVDSAVSGQ